MTTFKQFLEGSSNRAFAAGYKDGEVQKVTRRKGRKQIPSFVVSEASDDYDDDYEVSTPVEFAKYASTKKKIIEYSGKKYKFHDSYAPGNTRKISYVNIRNPNQEVIVSLLKNSSQPYDILFCDFADNDNPWKITIFNPKEYVEATFGTTDKDIILKSILTSIKKVSADFDHEGFDDSQSGIAASVKALEDAGFDWPELKTIKKAVESL